MNKRYFLLILCCWISSFVKGRDLPIFIENKGQWGPGFEYRAALKSADWIIQKDGFAFLLIDYRPVHSSCDHGHGHCHANGAKGTRATQEPIELPFQFFKQQFLNTQVPTFLNEFPNPTYFNYFLGNDPSRWKSQVRAFASITYQNLYPGIDLRVHTTDSVLHYDWIIKPHANPKNIQWSYQGLSPVIKNGNIVFELEYLTLTEQAPVAWQFINGQKVFVPIRFVKKGEVFTYEIKSYNPDYELIIDPVLVFSTLTGSLADNWGFTATYDINGNGFAGGNVNSAGYPTTSQSFQQFFQGGTNFFPTQNSLFYASDMAIIKYNANGTQRLYATYIGGSHNDQPHSIIADPQGRLYILGATRSFNFPVTPNAPQTNFGGNIDAVILVLDSSGSSLIGSTYLGGPDFDGVNRYETNNWLYYFYADDARGEIQLDDQGNVFVVTATRSTGLPTTPDAIMADLQGLQDGLIAKYSPDISQLLYLSYFGGTDYDALYGIAMNTYGEIYISGGTQSALLPTTPLTFQPNFNGGVSDGFVFHLTPSLDSILHGSYIGTSGYDQTYLLQTDRKGFVYLTGQTSGNFPTTPGVFNIPNAGQFLIKLDSSLTNVQYATRFGKGDGTPELSINAFLVDICERVYISCWGGNVAYTLSHASAEFIQGLYTTPNAYQTISNDGSDFYLIAFEPNATSVLYATYFGGTPTQEHVDGGTSRYDPQGVVYQSVCSNCGGYQNFPVTPGAFSTVNGSTNCNNALFKFDFEPPPITQATFSAFNFQPRCINEPAIFINFSLNADSVLWDFGDGTFSTDFTPPPHYYPAPDTYYVTLIAYSATACNNNDTLTKSIIIFPDDTTYISIDDTCGLTKQFTAIATGTPADYLWDFGDGTTSTLPNPTHTYSNYGSYNVSLIINASTPCPDTTLLPVHVGTPGNATFTDNFQTCQSNVQFTPIDTTNNYVYAWDFGFTTSTQPNPSITLPYADTFTVRLIVNPGNPCLADTFEKTYIYSPPSVADFLVFGPNCDSTITIQNNSQNATQYLWDFGDGSPLDTSISPTHTFVDTGYYTIKLITQPGSGTCSDSAFIQVYIPASPRAMPLIDQTLCSPTVQGSHQSLATQNVLWQFSDGFQSTQPSFVHTFPDTGWYSYMFIAGTETQCPDTLQDSIYIRPVSIANAQLNVFNCDTFIIASSQSLFADSLIWLISDGTTYTDPAIQHLFPDTGTYTIQLITMPNTPCADTLNFQAQFLPKPVANFSVNSEKCNRTLQFQANPLYAQQYLWHVLNDTFYNLPNLTYTFPDYGAYQVAFIASHLNGCVDTLIQTIIIDTPSVAVPIFDKIHCEPIVSFNQQSIRANNFFWDFGDGNTSTLPNPTHTYTDTGMFIVKFYTDLGTYCQDSVLDTLYVLQADTPNINIEQLPCVGDIVFSTSMSNIRSYLWNFGDGTTSTLQNPIHFYGDNPKQVTITLTVIDNNGCEITKSIPYAYNPNATSYIYIPNVFTPNGDGLNDDFRIVGDFPECVESVQIYDRWGNLIYETTSFLNPWDGTFQNQPAPEGAYVYRIRGKRFQRYGTVTLIR